MRGVIHCGIFAVLLGLAAWAPHRGIDRRGGRHLGVLIVTERASAIRLPIRREGRERRVSYQGDASVDMAGTVAPSGAVKVSIRLGDKGANGTGRLSDKPARALAAPARTAAVPAAGRPNGARVRSRDHALTPSASRMFASGALDTQCAATAAPAA